MNSDPLSSSPAEVVLSRTLNSPVERVWRALTSAEALQKWSFPIKAFRPEVGFEFGFTVEHKGVSYVHLCRVVEAVPNRRIAYTWRYEGHPGDSLVSFELAAEGDQTRVTLRHTGLDTFPKLPDFARENFLAGWTDLLGVYLKKFVEDPGAETASEIINTRLVRASRQAVWDQHADPAKLALWWGPKDFTNTFETFEFRAGGRWRFVMHAPDGKDWPNEKEFSEIVPLERISFAHVAAEHRFRMTLSFADEAGGTRITWSMKFESAEEYERLKDFIATANEQNLDRLEARLKAAPETVANESVHLPSADNEIIIARVFDAPRELVWRAFTDPKHVVNWWGPNGFTTEIETMEVRPGGVWKHTMIGPDGARYPNKSIFKEVVAPERISYSHGGGREDGEAPGATFVATWTFEALGPKQTRLTGRMVFPTAEIRDVVVRHYGAIEGGKQTLGRLAAYLPAVAA